MTTPAPDRDRDEVLEEVRATYRRYHEKGRERLWDPANAGYARMTADRNRALVRLIAASLPAGGSVIDVGCGRGDLAGLVAAEVAAMSWTGVDLLPEAITEARARYPSARWIEASADVLPFADADFDVVIASTLFSSLPTTELEQAAAAEVARVLKPKGWLIWYDLRYGNPGNAAVHGLSRRHVAVLFLGWQADLHATTLLPPIARRLGIATAFLYPVLEAVPPLRSHLIGRLQRVT